MLIRKAELKDLKELTDIYNFEVLNGVATFDLEPKTLEERKVWFDNHSSSRHPLIVAEIEGCVAGYASLSTYREKEAYKSTAELSVYIGDKFRGQGVATKLMERILEMAREEQSLHTVVSVITAGNEVSAYLHKKFGFEYCGTMAEVGMKFGRYLGIENYRISV
ncbi:MAG: N-acetyltransferase [Lachnospiraceae bacterium]|nr:N-acetyltransferase [Lachnospiraceae bacterium]